MWSWRKLSVTWGAVGLLALALFAGAREVLPVVALAALCHELGHLGGIVFCDQFLPEEEVPQP